MELTTTMRDFVPICKIGQGSFSSVYKVQRLSDDCTYALKKVKMGLLKQRERQNAINEIRLLASIEHDNIIGYKEAFYDENLNVLCIVMDYADGGDIGSIITTFKKQKKMIEQSTIWTAIQNMLNGLHHLHSRGILHRDLKPANVFLHSQSYKLGDLNVSKVNKGRLAYTQTGTPYYASPEVWRDQPYNEKSDVWSLGCIIYEMCALRPPFMGRDMEYLNRSIQSGKYETIPKHYSQHLNQFVASCLTKDPKSRPSCKGLLDRLVLQNNSQNKRVLIQSNTNLLKTIQLPSNLKALQSRLPKSKYNISDKKQLSSIIETCETPKHAVKPANKQDPVKEPVCSSFKENVPQTAEKPRKRSMPRTERASVQLIRRESELPSKILQSSNKKVSNRLEKCASVHEAKRIYESINRPEKVEEPAKGNRYNQISRLLSAFEENYKKLAIVNRKHKVMPLRMPAWWG